MRSRHRRVARSSRRHELDLFEEQWLSLTPSERLTRSWRLRARLKDPFAVHDAKLFPKPDG
jgi:hypothetical protein